MRPSRATAADRLTHGCPTACHDHPAASGPSGGGRRCTRASRPDAWRTATHEPSGSSSMVCWPNTQSGSWYSARSSTSGTASVGSGVRPVKAAAGTRYGSHHPVRSSTNTSAPSAPHRGWPTETPGPPATFVGSPSAMPPPSVRRAATSSRPASHGMSGWSQVTQASHRPSGDGRGAATKSPGCARTRAGPEPSRGTATRSWEVTSASVTRSPPGPHPSPCRSATETSHRPSGVGRPSA